MTVVRRFSSRLKKNLATFRAESQLSTWIYRIATHILAFEGDSNVTFFEGNWSEYKEDRKKRLGAAADQPHRIKYWQLTR